VVLMVHLTKRQQIDVVNRAQKLRTSKIDPPVDNMLKITGDSRKAALDMRLVDPFARPDDTKVSRAVEKITILKSRFTATSPKDQVAKPARPVPRAGGTPTPIPT
jgi:hypothetical protein